LPAKELERRGLALHKLRILSTETALFGRASITLQLSGARPLPTRATRAQSTRLPLATMTTTAATALSTARRPRLCSRTAASSSTATAR
jgi:hypothetical protein